MREMPDMWSERISGRVRHAQDVRTDHELDYARVVHSGAFRRLQGKTQILSLGDDDFYRTRLTHSLEVAQVAEGIVQHLRAASVANGELLAILPAAPLIQAIGLAHDIGHPPFGHGGEQALNYCMRNSGGFEGNAQTLRLLARLENFSDDHGADLTRRALLGILKYPALRSATINPAIEPRLAPNATTITTLDAASCKPVKACYDEDEAIFSWVLAPLTDADRASFVSVDVREGKHGDTRHKSLDCSIMDAADDIAYGVHDLEDAIALGFVTREAFASAINSDTSAHFVASLAQRPLTAGGQKDRAEFLNRLFGTPVARKSVIGRLVHYFIRSISLVERTEFSEPLLRWRAEICAEVAPLLKALQKLIVREVINSPRVQHLEFKGQRMVVAVFEAIASDPKRLLPSELAEQFEAAPNPNRIVCDYIANFTDGALLRTYERLFSPRFGSVFDRI